MNSSRDYAQKHFASMVVENGDVEAVQDLVDALLECRQERSETEKSQRSSDMQTEDGLYWYYGKPEVETVQNLVVEYQKQQAEAEKPQWSTEIPTEDGYYWYYGKPYYYGEESRLYLFGLTGDHFAEPGDDVGIFPEGFRPGLWLKIENPQLPEIK